MTVGGSKLIPDVERIIAPYRERALEWLKCRCGNLDSVPVDIQEKILRMPSEFEKTVRRWKSPIELQAEDERQSQELRNSRLVKLRAQRPAEYESLTMAGAKRPRQFKSVLEYALDMASSLYLFGPPRTGKTAAAWALAETAIEAGIITNVLFVKSTRFFRHAKSKHLNGEALGTFEDLFNRMLGTEMLVLDDLGSERVSEGASETAFELLDTRTEDHAVTVITSNMSLERLARGFGVNGAKVECRLKQFFDVVDFTRL